MSEQRAKEVIQDFDAFPEFNNWKSFAEQISIYGEERKGGVLNVQRTAGRIDNTRIFDTTMREALEIFSAGTVSDLTPQTEPWLDLEAQSFDASKEESSFYNAASDRVRRRIGQSNFYRGFHEAIHSGGMYGTFCISMVPSKKKLFNFQEILFGNFRFREDGDGLPDTVFHEMPGKTAEQVRDMFADEIAAGKAKLSEKMEECLKATSSEKKNEKFTVIHRVKPRSGASQEVPSVPSKRPYESVYVVKEDNHVIMDDDGFYYQPYIVCRLLKSRHDAGMGRSPGTQVYPVVRMINRAMRDMSVAIEKTVTPPVLKPSDSSYKMDLRAGGETIFDAHNPNSVPRAFSENPRVDFGFALIERLERQIKNAFFNDMFKFFTDRQVATTEKTAFETQLQAEEQLRLFTPIFLNIVDEALNRIVENVFQEMFIRGEFNDILPEGVKIGNFSVTYNSRIALAVRAQRTQGLLKMANLGAIIEQYVPGAPARAIDWEGAFAQAAQDSTVAAEFINDEETINQLKAKDEQINQLMQALEAAQMAGQAASQFASAQGNGQG